MSKKYRPKITVTTLNEPNLELMAKALINLYNRTGGKKVKDNSGTEDTNGKNISKN